MSPFRDVPAGPSRLVPARSAVALGLALGALAASVPGAHAGSIEAVKGRSCDRFLGTDLSRSAKWRVFAAPVSDTLSHVYSCRRGSSKPARVRGLGETYEISGPSLSAGRIIGDRVVITSSSGTHGASSSTPTLVDLRTGRQFVLPSWSSSEPANAHPAPFVLTATGALVMASWHEANAGQTAGPGGQLITLDARRRTNGPMGIVALAPSRANGGSEVYTLDVNGTAATASTTGEVRPTALPLRTAAAVSQSGRHLRAAPKPDEDARLPLDPAQPVLGFQLDRQSGTIVTPEQLGRPERIIATLAPGEKAVVVQQVSRTTLMVDARFADAPETRRTRILASYVGRTVLLDVPAGSLPAGTVALGQLWSEGIVAVSDGGQIRLWREGWGQASLPVAGATDLVFSPLGATGKSVLFHRVADGKPSSLTLNPNQR